MKDEGIVPTLLRTMFISLEERFVGVITMTSISMISKNKLLKKFKPQVIFQVVEPIMEVQSLNRISTYLVDLENKKNRMMTISFTH